ncbi:asparaginase [Bordetella sp. BOR01]|uniref:asparaginase n=1 Tax=Bordetella sp. BOR01 TaxID=2854779 RepID=UPI001C4687F4|nr:asparaginase [Bordetella sp. BOR01]MBV7484041.1 asparaginase [Bordetella sp. BOR01]
MSSTSALPRVALIGCGGTMSSLGTSSLDLMDYPEHGSKIDAREMLARIPEASLVAQVEPVAFKSVGSTALTPADWFALRAVIRAMARTHPDLAGFVIVHGTATLEETAFFLNLTLDIAQPVVLVGAQRPLSAVGSDAPMNLVQALRVAAAAESRGRGVLVVLNDEIHAARDVVKTSTLRLQTFRSADFGALGIVDPDGLHYYRRPDRPHAPDCEFAGLPDDTVLPRVDIVYSYAGADSVLIQAAIDHGARGLVSAGLAPGIPARGELPALEAAARAGIAVVQCSRAGAGRVARRRYLNDTGFIGGEDFSPQKARILLALGLASTGRADDLRRMFETY